jgi:integrase
MGVTVRQKINGKGKPWWVFVAHNGRRTSRLVGDKEAAEEVASKIRAKLKLGEFEFEQPETERMPTFREYAETFMGGYSKNNHKFSTHQNYLITLNNHLLPAFGKMPLDQIKRKDVKAFLFKKQNGRLAHSSVKNLRAYLSAVFTQAVDDEIITQNPVAKTGKLIKEPEELKERIIPLTWEEKNRLEATVSRYFPRWYPLLLTALRTGLRIGELIALKPEDIDFDDMFIEVRRGYVRGRFTTTKSNKMRKVDMSPQLAGVLKRYLVQRKEEALRNGWGEPPEVLFYNEQGRILNPGSFGYKVFQRWLKKAGLRRVTFHSLRHTYATLRLLKGDNILDVSKQLGHQDIKITTETYYHWIPGSNRQQVADLDLPEAPKRTLYAPKTIAKYATG